MLQAIERYLQEIRGERRTLRRCDQLRLYRKAVEAWRAKYAKLPRWGHKDIKNSSDDAPQGIEVLRDPDSGELTTDPQRKLGILHSMLQRLSAAPAGSKTGTYTTDTAAPPGIPLGGGGRNGLVHNAHTGRPHRPAGGSAAPYPGLQPVQRLPQLRSQQQGSRQRCSAQ
jgi:hypothetical protein